MKKMIVLISLFIITGKMSLVMAQKFEANYNEEKVPAYVLPDALIDTDGRKIETSTAWRTIRRPETLRLFENDVYGKTPEQRLKVVFKITKQVPDFMNGKATLQEVNLILPNHPNVFPIQFLVITPNLVEGPVPAFAGLNFDGNHSIHPSTEITLAKVWNPETKVASQAEEITRGKSESCWPMERIIDRGYALITCYYEDIDPDFDDGFKNGIHPAFDEIRNESSWGSIGAWAWGLSRMMDYAATNPAIDASKVAVIGHSRLGKAALWAGAQDERFAMIISNNSGCGGAALSRREFGETIKLITAVFPHWFCKKLSIYGDQVNELPVDQHQLIALIAPRPVYIASAEEDLWADPKGEFLSVLNANPVYQLLGTNGYPEKSMLQIGQSVFGQIGYHIRSGGHEITAYDWERYLDFADFHFIR